MAKVCGIICNPVASNKYYLCSCKTAVVRAVEDVSGVESAKASATRNSLTIKGPAAEADVRATVEKAGYTFKGKKQ